MDSCHLEGSKNGAVQRIGLSLGLGNISMKGSLKKACITSPDLAGLVIFQQEERGAHHLLKSFWNRL